MRKDKHFGNCDNESRTMIFSAFKQSIRLPNFEMELGLRASDDPSATASTQENVQHA